MPNDGSPYPRDFIIDQEGIIAYANNEIDTSWMIYVINELINNTDGILGDINEDGMTNILDVVNLLNIILNISNSLNFILYVEKPFRNCYYIFEI